MMEARLRPGVRIREDKFGGICYVPNRDDFFALSKEVHSFLAALPCDWLPVAARWRDTYVELSKLGICETRGPKTKEIAYSGPSFLGKHEEIPAVSIPLVLNCFCTSFCPLNCVYCHAADLMNGSEHETATDISNVLATASMIPAVVAVVTGGEPLARPARAVQLIEGLSAQGKAVVLDTSGVGDIDALLPSLIEHGVHVRVSLDSIIAKDNDKWRQSRERSRSARISSIDSSEIAIRKCTAAGIPVSVQTVVTSENQDLVTLRDLRDWLIARGVRHWVLHMVVRGGATRNEGRKGTGIGLKRSIPRDPRRVAEKLYRLVRETERGGLGIDIRFTDTANTPNSVFLIGPHGDLFTEGYAHHGKVCLYEVGIGRPDLLDTVWPHFDRLGHARRYLNWNPWFYEDRSLCELCRDIPLPDQPSQVEPASGIVENEAKYRVIDPSRLNALLVEAGFVPSPIILQRDEYYDTPSKALSRIDFVTRLRKEGSRLQFAFKGPRTFSTSDQYARIEIEVEPKSEASARRDMAEQGLVTVWYFEKRRVKYCHPSSGATVEVDEIPEIGFFAEIEGTAAEIARLLSIFSSALGGAEKRNYKDIFIAHAFEQGLRAEDIRGSEF